jgi:hypothetical protein
MLKNFSILFVCFEAGSSATDLMDLTDVEGDFCCSGRSPLLIQFTSWNLVALKIWAVANKNLAINWLFEQQGASHFGMGYSISAHNL